MKRKPKPIPKHIAELMAKVKGQLAELNKPVWVRGEQEPELTIDEYKRLDPYWLSTMTGEFAGRECLAVFWRAREGKI